MCCYRPSKCRFSQVGCPEITIQKEVSDHEKNCPFRLEVCRYCFEEIQHQLIKVKHYHLQLKYGDGYINVFILKIAFQDHLDNTCQNYEIPCPYQCGVNPAQRRQVDFIFILILYHVCKEKFNI